MQSVDAKDRKTDAANIVGEVVDINREAKRLTMSILDNVDTPLAGMNFDAPQAQSINEVQEIKIKKSPPSSLGCEYGGKVDLRYSFNNERSLCLLCHHAPHAYSNEHGGIIVFKTVFTSFRERICGEYLIKNIVLLLLFERKLNVFSFF